MNGAHFHLIVNHVPLFSLAFGFAAILWGQMKHSRELKTAGLLLLVLGAVSSVIALKSGEAAEHVVKNAADIVLVKGSIHQHEEAGELANVFAVIAGVLALASLVAAKFLARFEKPLAWVLLLVSLVGAGLQGRAANLGGLIRHSEIREGAPAAAQTPATAAPAAPEAGEKNND